MRCGRPLRLYTPDSSTRCTLIQFSRAANASRCYKGRGIASSTSPHSIRQRETISHVITRRYQQILIVRVDRPGPQAIRKDTRYKFDCGVRVLYAVTVRVLLALPARAGKRDAGLEQSGGVDRRSVETDGADNRRLFARLWILVSDMQPAKGARQSSKVCERVPPDGRTRHRLE